MENTGGRKYLFFAGGALFMMSMTLSSYGIATVTPRILSAFNAMQYYTLISLMASIGNLLFLPIAGKLIDTIGRKSLLLFGGLATLVSSIAAAACLLMYVMCPAVDKKPLPAIDWAGILNLFVITGSIMYISSFGPRQGWTTPVILVCYVLLIGGFFLFPRVEKRAVSPLVNLELFKNPVFVGTLMCTFMLVWYQSAMRNYIPLVVQNVMGQSAAASGMVSLPRSVMNVIFPVFCGSWAAKNMKNRCWKGLFIAGALIVAGMALCSAAGSGSSMMILYIGLGLTGIAESFKGATQTPALTASVSRSEMGSAMSLNSMLGSMGSAISTAVFGVVHSTICTNTEDVVSLSQANRAAFLCSAATGILVCILAFAFVRQMAASKE
ncbi:MAG: MFS transporter [Lachnospiraceae bacterium]|nr:MFS transporter [Lachnospiraceae bacterium]